MEFLTCADAERGRERRGKRASVEEKMGPAAAAATREREMEREGETTKALALEWMLEPRRAAVGRWPAAADLGYRSLLPQHVHGEWAKKKVEPMK